MKVEFTHSFENIPIQFIASFEYDGIGSYEYWGAKGFDRGKLALEEIDLVPNQFDIPPHIKNDIDYILDNIFDLDTAEAQALKDAADNALIDRCEAQNEAEYKAEQKMDKAYLRSLET